MTPLDKWKWILRSFLLDPALDEDAMKTLPSVVLSGKDFSQKLFIRDIFSKFRSNIKGI